MTHEAFYVRLLHALGNYDDATMLALLVAQGAVDAPVRSSAQKLAEIYLAGSMIDRNRVQRAVARLIAGGFVSTQAQHRGWTEFTVVETALRSLLARPVPESRVMPGLSSHPIPFLARLEAELPSGSATGAAPTAPTED